MVIKWLLNGITPPRTPVGVFDDGDMVHDTLDFQVINRINNNVIS